MHIAFLTSEYITEPYFSGGLANYLYRTSLGLTRRGHKVEIFTRSDKDEILVHDGILVHRVLPNPTVMQCLKRATRWKFHKSVEVFVTSWNLRQRLMAQQRQTPFDIVQAASYRSVGLGLVHFNSIPFTVRISSYEKAWREKNKEPYTTDQKMVEWIEQYVCRHSDRVYAPSQFLANIISKDTGLKMDVVRTPFLVETDTFDSSILEQDCNGFRYLLFFGTLSVLKGAGVLADALGQVLSQCPDMHIVLAGAIGTGPDGLSMLEYIYHRAGAFRARIHYLGVLHHKQLYPVIAAAEGVVLPSLIDNLPNACLEAMAFGRVVIGTRGASFDELLEHDKSGLLIPPGDAGALANAMVSVWQMDDDRKREIGTAAKQGVAALHPDIVCKTLEAYFQQLIPERA